MQAVFSEDPADTCWCQSRAHLPVLCQVKARVFILHHQRCVGMASPAGAALIPLTWRKEFAHSGGTEGDEKCWFSSPAGAKSPDFYPHASSHLQASEVNPVGMARLQGAEYVRLS